MGNDILLLSFVVAVFGGFASIRGTAIASLVFGTVEGMLIAVTNPLAAKTILIGLCCLFILVKKTGLFSSSMAVNRL